eukprot:6174707-Pleurochrysis_carterae.AAC.2
MLKSVMEANEQLMQVVSKKENCIETAQLSGVQVSSRACVGAAVASRSEVILQPSGEHPVFDGPRSNSANESLHALKKI